MKKTRLIFAAVIFTILCTFGAMAQSVIVRGWDFEINDKNRGILIENNSPLFLQRSASAPDVKNAFANFTQTAKSQTADSILGVNAFVSAEVFDAAIKEGLAKNLIKINQKPTTVTENQAESKTVLGRVAPIITENGLKEELLDGTCFIVTPQVVFDGNGNAAAVFVNYKYQTTDQMSKSKSRKKTFESSVRVNLSDVYLIAAHDPERKTTRFFAMKFDVAK